MTVCVTGDVHHMSLETRDQEYMDRTEVEAAIEYAEIAAECDVPVTLFCTGKCAVEEPDRMHELAEMENVEIGGHNYYAFDTVVHKGWRGLEKVTGGAVGSWNGPRRFQSWEIGKTIETFDELGIKITSWRDHAYRHDEHTAPLLAQRGITHFSDAVGPNGHVRRDAGLTLVPINTPPDHEHIRHGFHRDVDAAEAAGHSPFTLGVTEPVQWLESVLGAVEAASSDELATVLAHPSCQDLADGLKTFEALCEAVAENHSPTRIDSIVCES